MFKPPYENLGIGVSPYSFCCVFEKNALQIRCLFVLFIKKWFLISKQRICIPKWNILSILIHYGGHPNPQTKMIEVVLLPLII